MKATGIVRRIDDLGRVVIPKEIRRTLRIREEIRSKFIPQRTARLFLKNIRLSESLRSLRHNTQMCLPKSAQCRQS